eukprot:COSAG06_NODE_246_length_19169_cov_28.627950_13_plen_131_part_00
MMTESILPAQPLTACRTCLSKTQAGEPCSVDATYLYGREWRACSLWKRAGGQAFSVSLRERRTGCLRRGGGRDYSLASSPAGVWRFGGDGGVKSGSGNLVTACHDLLIFVLPNSSSNQPSNFALRILVLG